MFRKTRLIIKEVSQKIQKDDVTAWASQLTFYIILSFFPFIIFLGELINRVAFINIETVHAATEFFPAEFKELMDAMLNDISSAELSSTFISLTAIGTLWAASKGFMAISRALNMAYDQKETRNYFYLRGMSVVYTIIFAMMVVLVLVVIVFGSLIINAIFKEFPFLEAMDNTFTLFRYLMTWFFTYWFFIAIYNVTPNKRFNVKEVTPGAIFTSTTWLLLSTAFSFYVNNYSNYSYIYGSLTSIIVLFLWLFITSILIMVGGELNAVMSNIYDIKQVNEEVAQKAAKKVSKKKSKENNVIDFDKSKQQHQHSDNG